MRTSGSVRLARQELDSLGCAGLDSFAYRRQAAVKLRRLVPFDAIWWWTTDPSSSFFTSAMIDPHPTTLTCRAVHDNEFVEADHNKFRVLARRDSHIGLLSHATDADLERSRRYCSMLRPEGLEHELRLALVSESSCWGALTLMRAPDTRDFSPVEMRTLSQLAGPLADGLRLGLVMGTITAERGLESPGLIMLDERNNVLAMTPSAEHWCNELDGLPAELPEAVKSIAACIGRVDDGDGGPPTLRARVRTLTGRWLVVHGSRVHEGTGLAGSAAIIIEEAKPSEIAPLIVLAYGLSEREAEVTRLVLQGLSTKEIAATMLLSAYTVQDYLKSIFQKVDVRSRRELVARIFDQHYWPRYGDGDRTPDWRGSPAGLRDRSPD